MYCSIPVTHTQKKTVQLVLGTGYVVGQGATYNSDTPCWTPGKSTHMLTSPSSSWRKELCWQTLFCSGGPDEDWLVCSWRMGWDSQTRSRHSTGNGWETSAGWTSVRWQSQLPGFSISHWNDQSSPERAVLCGFSWWEGLQQGDQGHSSCEGISCANWSPDNQQNEAENRKRKLSRSTCQINRSSLSYKQG